ncbi:deferrochelatase/peroxidase EfeB [Motilibacter rhizosphaerae]|uniref:Deferrochelatase n=1 Tax=Motilibacter rhizosphaerae TaxID=598652 RepID=A0A4Q7NWW4_9ACTN|nr:iron uptake transporter deferrochelatase/peroxidase subunit [Motilibacter rhizosphaerae]RZS90892.1 deferrochelatase/peroxidase EfeB [Motilibacter rhizosphaerae]
MGLSEDQQGQAPAGRGVSRRRLLGGAVGGGAGLLVGAAGGYGTARATTSSPVSAAPDVVPFYGEHQAGVVTPTQGRLAFAAFDVVTEDVQQLAAMLGRWSAAAALMTAGQSVGPVETAPQAPPVDTGEAVGLAPGRLTVTVGFGPSLFDDRFGLADRRPAALAPLPALPGDALEEARSGGDLCVQACSDDPQVAFHVIRNFARIGRGTVVLRWSQLGFGSTASTSTAQETPRNLFGFKDGTNNLKLEDRAAIDDAVWVGEESDQAWMRGGTYAVTRRIRMHIESWDADFLADQESVIGRHKLSGAPLGGSKETDVVDLAATKGGEPVIPAAAHVRLASPHTNGGIRILRRGYSYTDGIDAKTGELDAGLFFIAFQKDAHAQFVPLQRRLGQHDALNEYITHTSSALFACPPGLRAVGDWFGKGLLGDLVS